MVNKLWSVLGSVASAEMGILGASEEQRRFLSSGYCCQQCGAQLINGLGAITVRFYAADGRSISQWAGGALRAKTAECPRCGHRWDTFGKADAPALAAPDAVSIVETERTEEFFGEDQRVIDNLRSSATLNRTFSVSKEWSKTWQLEAERASGRTGEVTLGQKDIAALRLVSEAKLRQVYSVSENSKETSAEDVSYQVQANSKLTVTIRWKRIWQHGFVVTERASGPIRVPFRVAVGMTFDQQQVEEHPEPVAAAPAKNA